MMPRPDRGHRERASDEARLQPARLSGQEAHEHQHERAAVARIPSDESIRRRTEARGIVSDPLDPNAKTAPTPDTPGSSRLASADGRRSSEAGHVGVERQQKLRVDDVDEEHGDQARDDGFVDRASHPFGAALGVRPLKQAITPITKPKITTSRSRPKGRCRRRSPVAAAGTRRSTRGRTPSRP